MPTLRSTIWIANLRQLDGEIIVSGVMSVVEAINAAHHLSLRMRYNPDIRLVTLRLPAGTQREQVYAALDQLSVAERSKLYHLTQHQMVD